MLGAYRFARDVWKRIGEEDLAGLSAEMSYKFLLSLFPFILFVVSAVGAFISTGAASAVVDQMLRLLPPESHDVVGGPIRNILETPQPGILSVSAAGALWAASSGMETVIKGLNAVHLVAEDRSFVRKSLLKVALTLLVLVVLLVAVGVVAVTGAVGRNPGLLRLPSWTGTWVTLSGMAGAFVVLLAGVAVIYWKAPALEKHPFKLVTPGALLFSLGWLAGTAFLSWYVANFADYNRVYGSIAGMIVLLVWAYWSGYLLLSGAALNAVNEERKRARRPIARDEAGREGQRPQHGRKAA